MPDPLGRLLDTSDFPARWDCGNWSAAHGWLHVAADVGVWSAYLAIALVLLRLARRPGVPFRRVVLLFAAFLLLCGTSHLLEAVIFWWPVYRLAGVLKLATAVVSWVTVVALLRVAPWAAAFRSPEALERQVAERTAELERANTALREGEARFRQLADAMPQIVWVSGPAGGQEYLNRRWVEYTGLTGASPEELARVCHPDDIGRLYADWEAAARTGTPYQCEFRLRPAGGGEYRWFLARALPVPGPDGRPAAWYGTSTDIDAMKRAEAELGRRRLELHLLLDTVPALIFYKDRDHRLIRVNREVVRTIGRPREEIEGRSDAELGSPHADRYRRDEDQVMATGEPLVGITEPLDTATGTRWLQTSKLPYRDEAGNVTGVVGFSVDVTERKQAEDALRESEARFRQLAEGLPLLVWTCRPDGTCDYLSPQWVAYTGLPGAGRLESGWLSEIHPDDRDPAVAAWNRAVTRGTTFDTEFRLRRADGEYRWFKTRAVALRDADGRVVRWFGTNTDINDRKEAEAEVRRLNADLERLVAERTGAAEARSAALARSEAALRESEQRFRAIFDQTFQFIGLMSPDGTLLEGNRTAMEAAGVSPGEVLGKPFWDTPWWNHDPEQQARLRDAVARAAAGEMVRFVATHPRPGGGVIWVDFSIKPFRDESGRVTLLIPEGRDITAIKQAAAELEAQDALLRQFIKFAPAAIAMLDTRMCYLQASDRWLTDYHLTGEVIGRSHYEVFTDIPERWKEVHRRVLAGAVEACPEDPFPRADGSVDWLQWEARPWHRAGGEVGGLIFFTQVITERKRAEERLRESRAQLTLALEAAKAGTWYLDIPRRTFVCSDRVLELHDLPPGPLEYEAAFARVHPDDRERVRDAVRRAVEGGERYEAEYRIAGEGDRWVASFAEIQFGPDGPRLVGLATDITDRKQSERRLLESEERFRGAFEHAAIGVALVAPDGRWLRVNRSLCGMLGYSEGELLATDFQTITHPDDLEADLGLVRQVLAGAIQTYQMEKRYFHKGGHVIHVLLSVSLVRDAAGRPLYFISQIQDITDRRRAEDRLRASLREKEVMLQEIHHRVKNNLAITVSLLNFQMRPLPAGPSRDALRQAQDRVRSMALVHEMLYQAPSLSEVELPGYVAQLVRNLAAGYATGPRVKTTLDLNPVALPLEAAIPFGLILNELVSNAFKYAFPDDRRGTLTVSLRTTPGGDVTLEVRDDGVGLPPDLDPFETRSLGLRLVRDLASQIGGAVVVERAAGTVFRLTFPSPGGGRP